MFLILYFNRKIFIFKEKSKKCKKLFKKGNIVICSEQEVIFEINFLKFFLIIEKKKKKKKSNQ